MIGYRSVQASTPLSKISSIDRYVNQLIVQRSAWSILSQVPDCMPDVRQQFTTTERPITSLSISASSHSPRRRSLNDLYHAIRMGISLVLAESRSVMGLEKRQVVLWKAFLRPVHKKTGLVTLIAVVVLKGMPFVRPWSNSPKACGSVEVTLTSSCAH